MSSAAHDSSELLVDCLIRHQQRVHAGMIQASVACRSSDPLNPPESVASIPRLATSTEMEDSRVGGIEYLTAVHLVLVHV